MQGQDAVYANLAGAMEQQAVGELLGEHKLEDRLAELHAIIRRMDMR